MTPSFEPQPQPHVKAKGYEVTKSLALPNLSVSESVQINEVSPTNQIIKKKRGRPRKDKSQLTDSKKKRSHPVEAISVSASVPSVQHSKKRDAKAL